MFTKKLNRYFAKSFLVVISITSVAFAQTVSYPYPGQPGDHVEYPNDPSYPSYPDSGYPSSREIKKIYVNSAVQNQRLPLRQLGGINQQYRGWHVVAVRARTAPNSPGLTVVSLVADGRIYSQQRNPGYQVHLVPQQRLVLSGTTSLQLQVSGSTYIYEIDVVLRRPQQGPPHDGGDDGGIGDDDGSVGGIDREIVLNLRLQLYDGRPLDLVGLINHHQYSGYKIESLDIEGYGGHRYAGVIVYLNNQSMGAVDLVTPGGYPGAKRISLSPQPTIGRNLHSLVLQPNGNPRVDRVTLRLSRF